MGWITGLRITHEWYRRAMEPHKSANVLMIGGAVAVLLIVGGAYYYLSYMATTATSEESAMASEDSVSAQVSSAVQTPAENLPETNPFDAEANPFTQYQNPFE